ncbi:hypothetical protein ACFVT5_00200 [Streptomyces sp. NPDC058001]|uniref:hypothetical protein n=1 Tax=Streptomyces sp. NPDC058001 TaxID=3346300 RepID=UPI0036E0512F
MAGVVMAKSMPKSMRKSMSKAKSMPKLVPKSVPTCVVGAARRVLRAGVALGVVGLVVGAAAPVPKPKPVAPAVDPHEADVAQHGSLTLADGRLTVRLTPQNHGPSDVADTTLRLVWSVPLTDRQELPAGCVRSARTTVLCRTGALTAGSRGDEIVVPVRLKGLRSEVSVRIDTLWNGGAKDINPDNNRHEVLVLETGDVYTF